ncbi:MAG: hypothetical protein LBE17_02315 [Treponema sp.]|nr:hypothetical protein [Treponema sp.]
MEAEQGIRPLGAQYLGPRQINPVEDRPINTPADFRGGNLRMPCSDAWIPEESPGLLSQ